MPVIRISDSTWERLKRHAQPFEDSPEDIVRKALDALDKHLGRSVPVVEKRSSGGRPRKDMAGAKLPQREFRQPLLRVLHELGDSAEVSQIRERLLPKIRDRLSDADFGLVSTGEERWWNATCWERSYMVRDGLLRSDSPRGRWELTDKGRQAADQAR